MNTKKLIEKTKLKLAILCPPFTGHLNPMLALGKQLIDRGNEVILFHYDINLSRVEEFKNTGIKTVGLSNLLDKMWLLTRLDELSGLKGYRANRVTVNIYNKIAQINLGSLSKLESFSFDGLIVDQSLFEGETISSCLKVPFINIANALMLNPDLSIPPALVNRQPNKTRWNKIQNAIDYALIGLFLSKSRHTVTKYRKSWGMKPYPSPTNGYFDALWSLTISQQSQSFEFERHNLSDQFYFAGPFIDPQVRQQIDFPWQRLNDNGKPLVYASLGTLQNNAVNIYQKIISACSEIDCQLVVALGESNLPKYQMISKRLPFNSNTIIVNYAPQLELLQRASVCITHAGINTVLESLYSGVPMIALPIANDQPGVAARIAYTQTGTVLKPRCQTRQLIDAIKKVLQDDSYQNYASLIQKQIKSSGGTKYAVDLIEDRLQYLKQTLVVSTSP